MQTSLPPVVDPSTGALLPVGVDRVPRSAEAFGEWLEAAWQVAVTGPVIDIDMDLAPVESRQYYRNSIRSQRTARLLCGAGPQHRGSMHRA